MMNDNLAREILMSHADTLAAGHDVTETLAARYPELAPLLRLAREIDGVLEAVAISAEFYETLKATLLQTPLVLNGDDVGVESAERPSWQVGGAVALGSAATGLAVYAIRRFLNGSKQPDTAVKPTVAVQ